MMKNSVNPSLTLKPVSLERDVGCSVGDKLGIVDGHRVGVAVVGSNVGDELGAIDGWYVAVTLVGAAVGC